MLEAAAQEIYLLGDPDRATKIQQDAVSFHEAAGNDRAAASARIWLGRYIWLLGDPDEAQRQNALAVEGLEKYGPSPELAMAYSFRAQSLMLVPEFEEAEHWARKAIEVAEATGATAALIHAYNNLGTCLMGLADASGIEYLRRSRDLAMEHHLPDEVGRANTNLAAQGSRIFPMPYEEMDQHLVEGMDYSGRTIPDGIFDRWIRAARSEFLVVTGPLAGGGAGPVRPRREQLRGLPQQPRSSACAGCSTPTAAGSTRPMQITAGVADTALRIGDLQAVIPVLTTQFAIQIGTEEDAGAVASLREVIERRGDISETVLSPWFAFEAADGLTTIFVRDPDSAALREGLELLGSFCARIAPDVLRTGDLAGLEVGAGPLRRGGRAAGQPRASHRRVHHPAGGRSHGAVGRPARARPGASPLRRGPDPALARGGSRRSVAGPRRGLSDVRRARRASVSRARIADRRLIGG